MWASHSSCQQSCLTENSVSLHCDGFFLSLFLILLSTKKVCGRNHKAKLTRAMLQPTVIGVFYTKGKRCIVLLSQCSGALSSSSFCSNGVKMYHILSRPALAKHLPWSLCWTLVGVLTGPQSLTGHKPDCDLGRTEWGRGQWRQALSIPLAWEDEWHFGQISLILVSCKCFIALSFPLTGVPQCCR